METPVISAPRRASIIIGMMAIGSGFAPSDGPPYSQALMVRSTASTFQKICTTWSSVSAASSSNGFRNATSVLSLRAVLLKLLINWLNLFLLGFRFESVAACTASLETTAKLFSLSFSSIGGEEGDSKARLVRAAFQSVDRRFSLPVSGFRTQAGWTLSPDAVPGRLSLSASEQKLLRQLCQDILGPLAGSTWHAFTLRAAGSSGIVLAGITLSYCCRRIFMRRRGDVVVSPAVWLPEQHAAEVGRL